MKGSQLLRASQSSKRIDATIMRQSWWITAAKGKKTLLISDFCVTPAPGCCEKSSSEEALLQKLVWSKTSTKIAPPNLHKQLVPLRFSHTGAIRFTRCQVNYRSRSSLAKWRLEARTTALAGTLQGCKERGSTVVLSDPLSSFPSRVRGSVCWGFIVPCGKLQGIKYREVSELDLCSNALAFHAKSQTFPRWQRVAYVGGEALSATLWMTTVNINSSDVICSQPVFTLRPSLANYCLMRQLTPRAAHPAVHRQ